MKKNAEYKRLDLKQSKLKSKLHEDMRSYRKWKARKSTGDKTKAPITMAVLGKQQAVINEIREQIEKSSIKHVQDLKKSLKIR